MALWLSAIPYPSVTLLSYGSLADQSIYHGTGLFFARGSIPHIAKSSHFCYAVQLVYSQVPASRPFWEQPIFGPLGDYLPRRSRATPTFPVSNDF